MRTIYLDCGMGAAGDMLTSALLELHPEPASFVDRMNALGIPGVRLEATSRTSCGIVGTHVRVTVDGEEELSEDVPATADSDDDHAHEHDHELDHVHEHSHDHHDHEHGHEHAHDHERDHAYAHEHHHHTTLSDVEGLIGSLDVPEPVRADALAVFGSIAEAEAHAHGRPVDQIHFHEVGTADAVADVVGVCLLFHELAPELVLASPVAVGFGQVRCAHGVLPVPAPATAHILRGVPIYAGRYRGELCTPTGAALLKRFVREFVQMPLMVVDRIGYGMGTKDFGAASCVRAFLGECER